jgi:hypothetical protein
MAKWTGRDVRGDHPRSRGRRRWRLVPVAAVMAAAALLVGACGDDEDGDAGGEIEREAGDLVEGAGARAVAEALRATLVSEDLGATEHALDIPVIQEAVADLPGSPDVTGIEDADGDGQDDDGRIQVEVEDEAACIDIAENGETDVSGGAC